MSDLILADERLNQKHWSGLRVDASPFRSAFEYAAIGMSWPTPMAVAWRPIALSARWSVHEDELLNLEFARLTTRRSA